MKLSIIAGMGILLLGAGAMAADSPDLLIESSVEVLQESAPDSQVNRKPAVIESDSTQAPQLLQQQMPAEVIDVPVYSPDLPEYPDADLQLSTTGSPGQE